MIKKLLIAKLILLGASLFFVPIAFAATFESSTGSEIDQWAGGGANYAVGQLFTASSDHTVTSIDVSFSNMLGGSSSGNSKVHIAPAVAGFAGTDIEVSNVESSVFGGSVNYPFASCLALTSGTQYVFWVEQTTGSEPLVGVADNITGNVQYGTNGFPTLAPLHDYAPEDMKFTINGDSGGCSSPPPPPIGGVTASSTNTYIFLITSYALFVFQLFVILMIFFIVTITVSYPVKLLFSAIKRLIRRA